MGTGAEGRDPALSPGLAAYSVRADCRTGQGNSANGGYFRSGNNYDEKQMPVEWNALASDNSGFAQAHRAVEFCEKSLSQESARGVAGAPLVRITPPPVGLG